MRVFDGVEQVVVQAGDADHQRIIGKDEACELWILLTHVVDERNIVEILSLSLEQSSFVDRCRRNPRTCRRCLTGKPQAVDGA